jgi:cation transport protein ChaC
MALRREMLTDENAGAIAAIFKNSGFTPLTPDERAASLAATLGRVAPASDVWVFGYGSLMWNPAFHHVEARPARVRGWHRRFCLWNTFGRGTPENPGLMLALERGGSCAGLALRVAADAVRSELGVLWNREMITGAYEPRWVRLVADGEPIEAVTFVVNRAHPRYAGKLEVREIARRMATASGPLGASREYLESTVAELDRLGLRDGTMHALLRELKRL